MVRDTEMTRCTFGNTNVFNIKQRDLLSDTRNVSDFIAYLRLLRITECSVHYRGTAPSVMAG